MAQALIFLAPGYEELEMMSVADILRRCSISLDIVSITDSLEVAGAHDITIKADKLFSEADFETAQMIILPGGIPGTPNLLAYTPLTDKIREFAAQGKWLSAVCAAPTVFASLGLLNGIKATCYPSHIPNLTGAEYVEENVVTDGIFITSRGAGTSIAFAAAIAERFTDKDSVNQVLQSIIYQ